MWIPLSNHGSTQAKRNHYDAFSFISVVFRLFLRNLADIHPALEVVAICFQLRDGQLDGAVGAAAGGEDGLKPFQALVQVHVHALVHREGADAADGVADEGSLRGSSEVVAARIRDEIQKNVEQAGIEVVEARITYLAYAPEIAAVMLQRQQASAIIDARKMIVDGAVGMVEMALDRLNENKVVELDDERKAAMVSNLLVVLCGNRDAQPIVNSGSLY